MPTPVSIAIRRQVSTEKSDQRIFGLARALNVKLPDAPAFTRNSDLREVVREEYIAECLNIILSEIDPESEQLKEREPHIIHEYTAPPPIEEAIKTPPDHSLAVNSDIPSDNDHKQTDANSDSNSDSNTIDPKNLDLSKENIAVTEIKTAPVTQSENLPEE